MQLGFSWRALLVGLIFWLGTALAAAASDGPAISLGHSTVPLNGPWTFALGDDPRWASPTFDDGAWERVDLTPAHGAHDGDVGITRYVPGWNDRGHRGYFGYAWYRLRVTVTGSPGEPLALAAPTAVDSAYLLYVDGRLLGGSADVSGATPVAYSIQPRAFALGALPASGTRTLTVALRVWLGSPGSKSPGVGGLHVAPVLGDGEGIDAVVQGQWLQTFKGYVVDAVEPALLLVLALMLIAPIAAAPRDRARPWLAAALVILALLRLQQVLLFWTQWESQRTYDVIRNVILAPLTLGAWTLAWRSWFAGGRSRVFAAVVAALTALYVAVQLLGRSWWPPAQALGSVAGAHAAATWIRLALLVAYLWAIGPGVARMRSLTDVLAVLAAVLAGVGFFAEELSNLHVKGIWFPWGVGVSRTQYAYAGLIVVLFALILAEVRRAARPEA
ncbi:hypothetical protein [Phenylobacterium sp.]|uniref:hypothetical protein n=1 Tax=Phenylobacterium sp. TaxID=1871053 RepID=UPI0035623F15